MVIKKNRLDMIISFLSNILRLNFNFFFCGFISSTQTSISLFVKKEYLLIVLNFLKYSGLFRFNTLLDIFAVDCLSRSSSYRFLVYYVLFSRTFGLTLTVKVPLSEIDIITSVTGVYVGAEWLEREVYDMYGIYFLNSKDMRRILTDYGFEGFPLRKDFPLTGFFELNYSEEEKVVISLPTKVNQALRLFHFSSVWDLTKKN